MTELCKVYSDSAGENSNLPKRENAVQYNGSKSEELVRKLQEMNHGSLEKCVVP